MVLRTFLFLTTVAFVIPTWASDQVPGEPEKQPVALVGGDIHTVEGEVIAGGTLIFEDGKITALGKNVPIPEGAREVKLDGHRVYPTFIACGTQMGLVEIGAVRATRDQAEVGDVNPNVRAEVSVNPDSEIIPVTRANGIGMCLTFPQGGLVSGSSALIRMDGWTWEDLTFQAPSGIHVHWPNMHVDVPGDEKETKKRREERDDRLARIRAMFEAAQAYRVSRDGRSEVDLRCEALLPCLDRKIPVFVHASEERQIRAALRFIQEFDLRGILVGGRDAVSAADALRAARVPVIFGAVHGLPGHRDDAYDTVFAAPGKLYEAGVQFAIANFWTSNTRNLPYEAGMAAAYGLPKDEALKSITLYPAQILGVGDRVGSLAKGKLASLMVTDGDPLEITTQVKMMWLEGAPVDLTSRHTMLYEKYKKRIRRNKKREF